MRCPGCGEIINMDELERICREDFNLAHGSHFEKQEKERKSRWFWRGFSAGVVLDLFIVCFLWVAGGWSWDGFIAIIHRMAEKSFVVSFAFFFMPLVIAMICGMLGSEGVDVEEEQAYRKFKEGWGGCKYVDTTKEVL